jgi:K+-sensing histidine kinase KdpD
MGPAAETIIVGRRKRRRWADFIRSDVIDHVERSGILLEIFDDAGDDLREQSVSKRRAMPRFPRSISRNAVCI